MIALSPASNLLRIVFLVFVFTKSISAHDLYLIPDRFVVPAGETFTVAFHNGDDFPVSQSAPRVERIIDPQLVSTQSVTPLRDLRISGTRLLGRGIMPLDGTVLLSAHTKPNKIELTADSFESYLKHEGLTGVVRWRKEHEQSAGPGIERYSKYVKAIVHAGKPSKGYQQVLGFPLEIFVDTHPAELHAGSTLPVRVLLQGKPAIDQQVEMAWLAPEGKATIEVAGRTDASGRLNVPIRSAGTWKLHTVAMERCKEPSEADWESFWASLTFEVR